METAFVFPGSFDLPTYGHVDVLRETCKLLPFVYVLCSKNPDKEHHFSMAERRRFWHSYDLPENCEVITFDQVSTRLSNRPIVMVRGLRYPGELKKEEAVMEYNLKHFNINSYLYIVSKPEFETTSSSSAWAAAQDLNLTALSRLVSPVCTGAMLEKILGIKNLFLVVGLPGAGKSTFLKALAVKEYANATHIETDTINDELKHLLANAFPGENLIEVLRTRKEEFLEVIAKPWLEELANRLRNLAPGKNVFVEAAYGMTPPYDLFRFLGGKILYVGSPEGENQKRIIARGTPEHLPLINEIYGLPKTRMVAEKNHLQLFATNTGNTLGSLKKEAERFAIDLMEGDLECLTSKAW